MRRHRTLDRDVALFHGGGDGDDGPDVSTSDPTDLPSPAPA